jgi:transcriptional regulator with XRE-family HTH domain
MIRTTQQYLEAERTMKDCIGRRWRLLRILEKKEHEGCKRSEMDKLQKEIDRLQWQAQQITGQMKEYVSLQTWRIAPPDLSDVSNLPANLIRARIATGWTPNELAKRLGVVKSQIHRWESSLYAAASLSAVLKIAQILHETIKQQDRPETMLGQSLLLGSDLFDRDFRELGENEFENIIVNLCTRPHCDHHTF